MKRINPQTGKPFKSGDVRNDGMIFHNYHLTRIKKDGYYEEIWTTKKALEKEKQSRKNARKVLMSTKLGHIKLILKNAKYRAKKKNLDFDLSAQYILDIAPNTCPILKTELSWTIESGKCTSNSPSIDRINPELGYIRGNVQIVSHRANTIKSDATIEEIRNLLLHMEKNND